MKGIISFWIVFHVLKTVQYLSISKSFSISAAWTNSELPPQSHVEVLILSAWKLPELPEAFFTEMSKEPNFPHDISCSGNFLSVY